MERTTVAIERRLLKLLKQEGLDKDTTPRKIIEALVKEHLLKEGYIDSKKTEFRKMVA